MNSPILAYVFEAAMHCEDCIGRAVGRRTDETTEDALDRVAEQRGIDRDRENDRWDGIDQNDFPVRVYDIEDCIDEEGRPHSCDGCFCPLGVQTY